MNVDTFCEKCLPEKASNPLVPVSRGSALWPHPPSNSCSELPRRQEPVRGRGRCSALGRLCRFRGGCLSSLADLSSLSCLAPGPAAGTQCRPFTRGPRRGGCGQKRRRHTEQSHLRHRVTAGDKAPEASHGSPPETSPPATYDWIPVRLQKGLCRCN